MDITIPRSPDLDGIIEEYREGLKEPWLALVKSITPKMLGTDCYHQPVSTGVQRTAVRVAERVAFKFVFKMMKKVPSHAPDIMQEAYYVAMLCSEKYLEHANHDPLVFEKLVARATKRRLIDYAVELQPVHMPIRSFNRGMAEMLGFKDSKITMTTIEDHDQPLKEKEYSEEEANAVMDRLFSHLSDEDKRIAKLRHSGLTFEEIGAEVGLPKSTVEYKIRSIQKNLI